MIATALAQPAPAPVIFTGKQDTRKPYGSGQRPRLAMRSIWQYIALAAGDVGRPQHRPITGLPVPLDDVPERSVQAERVRTDHPHPQIEQQVHGRSSRPVKSVKYAGVPARRSAPVCSSTMSFGAGV